MKKELVCFLHIPKTAGTSLRKVISTKFTQEEYFEYLYNRKFDCLDNEKAEKIKCLVGHFYFGQHYFFSERNFRIFTFFREPIERLKSQFFFSTLMASAKNSQGQIGLGNKHPLYQHLAISKDPQDIILNSKLKIFDNQAVRQIAGVGIETSDPGFGKLDKSHLIAAKKNLIEYFEFIGFQERYSDDLDKLCQQFGFSKEVFEEKKSAGRTGDYVFNQTKLIEDLNWLDLELFKFARKLFW